jgi:hypothetical protein
MKLDNHIRLHGRFLGRSEKAIHFKSLGGRSVWLPLSQIVSWHVAGKTIFLTLPPWLAQKHGLQADQALGKPPVEPERGDIKKDEAMTGFDWAGEPKRELLILRPRWRRTSRERYWRVKLPQPPPKRPPLPPIKD